MKKIIICLFLILFITSCSSLEKSKDKKTVSNDNIYQNNYYSGEAENYDEIFDDGFDEGFIEGYYSGFYEIYNSVHEAEHYALDKGGWHPEEAVAVIEMYRTKVSYYPDGSIPTEEEYLDAINSLVAFYEYFYSAKYEELCYPVQ